MPVLPGGRAFKGVGHEMEASEELHLAPETMPEVLEEVHDPRENVPSISARTRPQVRRLLPGLEDALISNARRRGSAGGRHITWGWTSLAGVLISSRVSTGHHLLSHNFGSRIAGRYRGCVGVPSLFIRR